MSIRNCLSMLELVAYRTGEDPDGVAEAHLAECARCRALLADLPELMGVDQDPTTLVPTVPDRPVSELPEDVKTGQVWAATVEGDPNWRELVVVLARQSPVDDQELVLVAPVNTELSGAASPDIVVDDSPLGYRHLVSVGLQGVVLRGQLERYLGRLQRPTREALAAAYRSLLSDVDAAAQAPTSPPLAGPDDPRTWARAVRADELRPLFAPASRLLGIEEDEPETLGAILTLVIGGDEWDRPSLLSASGVGGASLDRMLHDRLDLTNQLDIGDVGRVLTVISLDDWRGAVRQSLSHSPGGLRKATGQTEAVIAARTFAGVPDSQRERDLMRDQSSIDDSPAARKHAIDSYLHSLEKELDDAP